MNNSDNGLDAVTYVHNLHWRYSYRDMESEISYSVRTLLLQSSIHPSPSTTPFCPCLTHTLIAPSFYLLDCEILVPRTIFQILLVIENKWL